MIGITVMSKDKKRSKEYEEAMVKYLTDKFDAIDEGMELIPVIMQREQWKALVYSIELALQLKYKKDKKHGNKKD